MKKRSTKQALIASLLAFIMCVSMFVGSTFAWFTDSATSANNKIVAGTLQIDLEVLDGNNWTSIKDSNAPIFNYTNIEPGFTGVEVLRVSNKGTLALKWYAKFISESGLSDLAEVIDVYVKPGETAKPADLTGYQKVGTLKEFVNTIETTTYGTLEEGASATLGIAFKMQETAGNKYQGMDLGAFDIQIVATQYTSESDAFGNQYDANANVYTASTTEEAQALIYSVDDGAIIQLSAGDYGKLMLQSAYVGEARTIKNLTIKGAAGVNVAGIEVGNKTTLNNVVIDSINFTGEYDGFHCNAGDAAVNGLTINNCTMTDDNTAQFVSIKAPSPKNVKITNCTVDGAQRLITMVPSNNVTITGNTMKNLTKHGIHLDNSGGLYHTGTIVIANNTFDKGTGRFIRIANLAETNTLIVKNNAVTNYMGGTDEMPYEDDYIRITSANGKIDIMGNTATDASALGGYPARGHLYVSVNDEEYAQPVLRP